MKGQRKKKEYERPSENTGHDFDLPVKKKKSCLRDQKSCHSLFRITVRACTLVLSQSLLQALIGFNQYGRS